MGKLYYFVLFDSLFKRVTKEKGDDALWTKQKAEFNHNIEFITNLSVRMPITTT